MRVGRAIGLALGLCVGRLLYAGEAVSPGFTLDLRYAPSGMTPSAWATAEAAGISAAFVARTVERAVDSDGDALPDAWEQAMGLDPAVADGEADPDGDGRTNREEFNAGTHPLVAEDWAGAIGESAGGTVDTGAYPLGFSIDRDGDGLPDWWEARYGLDPLDAADAWGDPDGDEVANLEEYLAGTQPNHDDRLVEVWGLSTGFDVDTAGRAPDSDKDGLPDAWEVAHGLNPHDPSDAQRDSDGDGQTNLEEYNAGTHPLVADLWERSAAENINGPFVADTRVEIRGHNPSFDETFAVTLESGRFVCDTGGLYYDWDGDGIPNWWEARYARDKVSLDAEADPDGDGYANRDEFILYSDPTDARSAFQLTLDTQGPQLKLAAVEGEGEAARVLYLSWPSAQGRRYRVLTKRTLVEAWEAEALYTLEGTGGTLSVPLPASEATRFFRVTVELIEP
ncbi:MAG: hypothetical protein ACI4QJ_05475 [Candidatus Spyradenecus sp.]